MGLDAWLDLLRQKRAVLDQLLADWNDGRRKTLYCAAAYLLEPQALRRVMEALAAQSGRACKRAGPSRRRAAANGGGPGGHQPEAEQGKGISEWQHHK